MIYLIQVNKDARFPGNERAIQRSVCCGAGKAKHSITAPPVNSNNPSLHCLPHLKLTRCCMPIASRESGEKISNKLRGIKAVCPDLAPQNSEWMGTQSGRFTIATRRQECALRTRTCSVHKENTVLSSEIKSKAVRASLGPAS